MCKGTEAQEEKREGGASRRTETMAAFTEAILSGQSASTLTAHQESRAAEGERSAVQNRNPEPQIYFEGPEIAKTTFFFSI